MTRVRPNRAATTSSDSTPFCSVTSVVRSSTSGATSSRMAVVWCALTQIITRSATPTSAARSDTCTGATVIAPSDVDAMWIPVVRSASSCAPRAMKRTSCPARTSSPPKNAPTPPAPNTTMVTRQRLDLRCRLGGGRLGSRRLSGRRLSGRRLGGRRLGSRRRLDGSRRDVLDSHVTDQRNGTPCGGKGINVLGAHDRQPLAKNADTLMFLGNDERDGFDAGRRHGLQAPRAAAAADAIEEIGLGAELVVDDRSPQQEVVGRQNADPRRVPAIGLLGVDEVLRKRMTVVQIEHQGDGTDVRRQRDDGPGGGIVTDLDVAVRTLGRRAGAERRRGATYHRRFDLRHGRGRWRRGRATS